ncbi:MAG: adenylate/guanylate cyclase domain-containing protein [Myxococcota bacterium]
MSSLKDTFASYVPELTARLITQGHAKGEIPLETYPAAVLFADTSGFTAFTERLASRGPAGAEELTTILNNHFGQLIALLRAHGGDVVKFAGDALIAVWPSTEEGLNAAILGAARAGLEIQKLLSRGSAVGLYLAMRLAIGGGTLTAGLLGGAPHGRPELLLAGEALDQLSPFTGSVRPGEVALSMPAWARIADLCEGKEVPAVEGEPPPGIFPPPPTAPFVRLTRVLDAGLQQALPVLKPALLETEALRPFIPEAIRSRLNAGQRGWLAEMRRVTVLFARLPTLPQLLRTDPVRAQAVVSTLQRMVSRLEGVVNKLSLDDKGVCLVAGFGLPPLAHEDDPVRAVRCALELRDALQQLQLTTSIGLTTGRVYCGAVGNDLRREYTLMGDVVNIAARFMVKAEHDIYCDEATAQAARHRVEFAFVSELSLRGKHHPMPAWRPLRPLAQPQVATRSIVGRLRELEQLEGLFTQLIDSGQGGVMVLEGEAGIGKSTLTAAALRRAELKGLASLVGAGSAEEQNVAYFAWRPIILKLLAVQPEAPHADVMRRLERTLAPYPGLVRLMPLLSGILPFEVPDNDETRGMSGVARADNTRELLVRLVEIAAARQPTLILLEDGHWLDSAAWAVASHVAQRVPHVILLLTTRPLPEGQADAQRLLALPTTRRIWLEPLGEAETAELVCQRLGVAQVPPALVALIRERADGQPLFSEELALALRDEGRIVIEGSQCKLVGDPQQLQSLPLPDTVQGILTARIDRLEPAEQFTFKVSSVLGRTFQLRLLRDIHPISDETGQLPVQLDALVSRGLLVGAGEGRWQFRHALSHEVAYDLMSFAQRRNLHRRVAEWYEQHEAEGLSLYFAVLAWHWERAGELRQAFHYLERAGEQAYRTGADQEAASFFKRALELFEKASPELKAEVGILREGRWRRMLADATLGLGDMTGVTHQASAVLSLLDDPLPRSKSQWIWLLLVQAVVQAVVFGTARWRRAPPPVEKDHTRRIEAALASERLSEAYYFQSDVLKMLAITLKAVNLADASGRANSAYRAYAIMGMLAGMFGLHRVARGYFRRGERVAQQLEDRRALTIVQYYEAVYLSGYARWDEVERIASEGLERARQLGVHYETDICLTILLLSAYFRGRFERARQYAQELLAKARSAANPQHQAWGNYTLAEALIPQGRYAEALKALGDASQLLEQQEDALSRIIVHGLTAVALLRSGEETRAEEEAMRVLERTRRSIPYNWASLEGYAAPAEVLLERWEHHQQQKSPGVEPVARAAREAVTIFERFAQVYEIARPRLARFKARQAWLEGRTRRARREWERSLAWSRRLDMPWEEAQALFELGRFTQLPVRSGALERAHAIFSYLGCWAHVAQIEQLWQPSLSERPITDEAAG